MTNMKDFKLLIAPLAGFGDYILLKGIIEALDEVYDVSLMKGDGKMLSFLFPYIKQAGLDAVGSFDGLVDLNVYADVQPEVGDARLVMGIQNKLEQDLYGAYTHPDHKHVSDIVLDELHNKGLHIAEDAFALAPQISVNANTVDRVLDRFALDEGQYTVLLPGSSERLKHKRWPHYAALAKEIDKELEQLVFLGTSIEKDLLHGVQQEAGHGLKVMDLAPDESAALLWASNAVVGNDSGSTHLAASVGAEGVMLFGQGSSPETFAPRGSLMKLLQKDDIAEISVKDVLEKLAA